MIDLTTEELISLKDACQLLPRRRRGRKPSFSTIWRWALHGARGVKLETLRVGGTLCTSREALQRFFDKLSERDGIVQPEQQPGYTTPGQRQRAVEQAERKLARVDAQLEEEGF